jgi:hypothetical protein
MDQARTRTAYGVDAAFGGRVQLGDDDALTLRERFNEAIHAWLHRLHHWPTSNGILKPF